MSIENAIRKRDSGLAQISRVGLNVKYPREFELYVCALEMVDEDNNTLRYFIFPVMPSTMDENKPQATNIKKTLAGITVLTTPTFIPTDITLSGNFGRKFRILLGTDFTEFIASFKANTGKVTQQSFANGIEELFDDRVKTGYGCVKILEEIIEECNVIGDDGKIRRLIWHNPALGNSYLVKPISLRLNQSQESNMIWNYSLQLKSIAPLESIRSQEELKDIAKRLNTTAYIQQRVDGVVDGITSLLAKSPI